MPFTDDDLKRLKETNWHHNCIKDCGLIATLVAGDLPRLLARLEAAEQCAGYLGSIVNDTNGRFFLEQWYKSSGKDK